MENEKIAIIALVVIIAGALTVFAASGNIEGINLGEIFENLSFGQGQSGDAVIEVGDCADVNYIGRFADNQTVFDTSYEEIAKDEGIYDESMPYAPLKIFVDPDGSMQLPEGYSNYSSGMIEGFLEGLIGMKEGETKTVSIPPEKAYGIWNQTLAESYGLSPYPIESPVDIEWDMELALFSQYFADVNLSNGTTFDWGLIMLGIEDTINATITDISDTNVTYEVDFVNGTTFAMPLFNWNVTILANNETTFLLRTFVEEDFVTTMDLGYGQSLHLKVVSVNETEINLALNQVARNKKFIGQTLEFDLEVVELYKTSQD